MASFSQIFIAFLYQLIFSVGVIFVFGFLIAVCNKTFYKLIGPGKKAVCYATGLIGTPVHELGHAFFCLLFGHKIIEIRLYRIDDDGVLGYVRHSYKKTNVYQRAGNFFIAVGPIIFGTAVLFLLLFLLVPSVYGEFAAAVNSVAASDGNVIGEAFYHSFIYIGKFFATGFSNVRWWIYLVLGVSIAIHMNLSKSDIKNSGSGLVVFVVLLFLINLITGLISAAALEIVTNGFMYAGSFLFCTLLLSLVFSLIYLLVALIVYAIRRAIARNKA